MKLAVLMREAVQKMRFLERRLAIEPARRLEFGQRPAAGGAQRRVDDLAGAHLKAGMLGAEALRQRADHFVVGAAALRRLDRLAAELQILMAAAGVDVVVLEEHRRRQHDIGMARGVGEELLVDAGEQVLARKAAPHLLLIGRDDHRVGVLDQHRLDRAAALQRLGLAGEDRADPRLIEPADARIARVEPLDQGLVELVDAAVGMQRAAALVRPGSRDGGNAHRGVHVRGAVALAREAVAEPEERALVAADQRRESFDVLDGEPRDRARPARIARAHMRLEPLRIVGMARHVVAVGPAVAEQHMHHRAGERAVRAGLQPQRQIGLPHRLVVVDVDRDDLRAALLSRAGRVGHQIDLRRDRVGPPNDDAVRLGDLERS